MEGEAGGFPRLKINQAGPETAPVRSGFSSLSRAGSLGGGQGWTVSKIPWASDQDVVSGCTGANEVGRGVDGDCLGQLSGKWKSWREKGERSKKKEQVWGQGW